MNIGVILYAYHLVDPLDGVLTHLLNETDARIYLFLHSSVPDVVAVCMRHAMTSPRVRFYDYGYNRGLSLSVNDALIQGYGEDGCDAMITCNDDVTLRRGDIERLADAAAFNPNAYLVEAFGNVNGREEGINTACAVITKKAIETLGYFDQNFWPAYWEDVDYNRRGKLAGLEKVTARDTYVRHVGSASLRYVPDMQHHRQFLGNRFYYIQKWVGARDEESAVHPFNNPDFSPTISAEARFDPYPGHGRNNIQEFMSHAEDHRAV